jgi:hypothetical protein
MDGPEANGDRGGRGRFDPVAGMRAMAEIQAEGLRAAGDVLDRILGSEPAPGPARARREDYSALIDAWTQLMRRGVSVLTNPPGGSAVSVDGDGPGPVTRVVAGAGAAEVWLHNGSDQPVGPLTLRCGPLSDAGGVGLAEASVTFDPAVIDTMPERSSRGVRVSVSGGSAPAGVYRGVIQAEGAPAVWIPLEVTVR